jgi:hypothetical protein
MNRAPTPPTTKIYLRKVADDIEAGPFTLTRVAAEAGLHPTVISRWRSELYNIEPRLSAVEKLAETHERMLAEWRMANPEAAAQIELKAL